jgi:hypothetical protein
MNHEHVPSPHHDHVFSPTRARVTASLPTTSTNHVHGVSPTTTTAVLPGGSTITVELW